MLSEAGVDDMTQEPPSGQDAAKDHDPPRDGGTVHAPAAVQSLKLAMRRARSDEAERAGALADLRIGRISRLECLHEALRPLIAQVPADVDLFDIGLMPGANPRLFIDMIGFVEMGRDARKYRFIQDSRHGRVILAESVEIPTMVEAITDYVARRLLERDKALASDALDTPPAKASEPAKPAVAVPDGRSQRGAMAFMGAAFAFLIDLLGSIAFFTILAGIGWVVWSRMHGQVG